MDNKKSLWKESAGNLGLSEELQGNLEADVVVIGAGITGLTTALQLSLAGKKVIVLEAYKVGDGTTGFSSCHLTTDIDEEYRSLHSDFGEKIIKIVAESRKEAINFIEKTSKEKNIDCDFKRLSGYWYTEKREDVSILKEEAEYAKIAGLDVELIDSVTLPFLTEKALAFKNQSEFNSQKYLNGLSEYLKTNDSKIYENSMVIHIDDKDDYYMVKTGKGSVKSKQIVMATHVPIFFNILQTVSVAYRSYIIAVKLKNQKYPEGLFWDTDEPYHYTRTYRNGANTWLVVGGEDHKTGHEEYTEKNFAALEKYVRERYEVESVDYRWSSQYYESADGLPYIGRSPFSKNAYVATGFSGDGLVYGTIAGILISDMILGKENNWLKAYDSTRFTPVASAYEFIKENADVARNFVSDKFKVEDKSIDELAVGEGKIIKVNGEKLAVSRDENKQIHALSPVCPHMGCLVHFNSSEKSWDCPCHGSRFGLDGKVLSGPAVKALEDKNDIIYKTEAKRK